MVKRVIIRKQNNLYLNNNKYKLEKDSNTWPAVMSLTNLSIKNTPIPRAILGISKTLQNKEENSL